jgi:hypothetical protein
MSEESFFVADQVATTKSPFAASETFSFERSPTERLAAPPNCSGAELPADPQLRPAASRQQPALSERSRLSGYFDFNTNE